MSKMPVAKFKHGISNALGRVEFGREQIVITKHGKPVARLVPVAAVRREQVQPSA